MRRLICVALTLALAGAAYAELQNIEVGGELRMRGRYYRNAFATGTGAGPGRQVIIPNNFVPRRAIGPNGVSSIFDWDDDGNDWHFLETALVLDFCADFTDNVSAFIQFYDFWIWGEDFRSNYITGADSRANSSDDIEINQAYIEMNQVLDQPLRLRIGRQALKFGKGWLITDMLTPTQRLSFDGIRLTYDVDAFTVDAFWAKLAETGITEEDGDVDLYGVYATYKALEPVDLSAYWFWLRDARSRNDTNFIAPVEWVEDLFGLDDYDVTNLHTVGIRANGKWAALDYDLEVAYQFGEADAHGSGFVPFNQLYGDDGAEYDNWGADLEVGYTLEDMPWSPRIYVGGVYFEGQDERDVSFWEWMNPFYRPEASVSFNRLFSDRNYMPTVNDNGWMSNFYQVRGGVTVHPLEKITVTASVAAEWADETFDFPTSVTFGEWRIPVAPALSFWSQEGDDFIGWETALVLRYDYSEDLMFLLYWNHLFVGDGLAWGSFSQFNGTDFTGGTDQEDADYVFIMTKIKF
ncbi:MAG: alginate export family protein [Candidatus Hydrogenedentes bacterium]|nr:alginate export family protein [Candidatus Hydrogenedentota bacterium]